MLLKNIRRDVQILSRVGPFTIRKIIYSCDYLQDYKCSSVVQLCQSMKMPVMMCI